MSVKHSCPGADDIPAISGSGFELDRHRGRHISAVVHEALYPGYSRISVLSTPLTGYVGGSSSTSKAVIASITVSVKDETGVPVLAKDGALSIDVFPARMSRANVT
jgi:hypothetical protein